MYRRRALVIISLLVITVALVFGIRSYDAYRNDLLEKQKEEEAVQKVEQTETTDKKVFIIRRNNTIGAS